VTLEVFHVVRRKFPESHGHEKSEHLAIFASQARVNAHRTVVTEGNEKSIEQAVEVWDQEEAVERIEPLLVG
jgi:hypothetical protein